MWQAPMATLLIRTMKHGPSSCSAYRVDHVDDEYRRHPWMRCQQQRQVGAVFANVSSASIIEDDGTQTWARERGEFDQQTIQIALILTAA
jgi:hypothetical protein